MTERTKEETLRIVTAFSAELKILGEQFEKSKAMEKVLTQDMLECGELVNGETKTDSASRSLVRAVFALIEGNIFNLKQMALNLSTHGRGNFSKAELAMLVDENSQRDVLTLLLDMLYKRPSTQTAPPWLT
jgi:hypothetical protein